MPRDLAANLAVADVEVRQITPRIVREIGIIHRHGPLSPAADSFLELALQSHHARSRPAPRRR